MKLTSYWHDTAPSFSGAAEGPVEGKFDVAVVGGGFTGLSAAYHLAKSGASVVVLESDVVGSGASGRNGGHLNNGISHSYLDAMAKFGVEGAKTLYRTYDDAIDTIERIVAEERIDCAFRRSGKLKLASKPKHMDAIARNFEAINREVDPETRLLSAADLKNEVGSDKFHGAMLYEKSAMMHMGRFVTGIADAACRAGARIFQCAPVTDRGREGAGYRLTTPRGSVVAGTVFVATGAYTSGPFEYFRRRLVRVGSFLVTTRPLSKAEIAATMPGNRTCVTSLNVGNYFRMSPDDRLIFGGRARFSVRSDLESDAKSGAILKESLAHVFPHLAGVEIDYCWGGLVDMTIDRHPRAGFADDVWFAMGFSGHGAQMSVQMGKLMADAMLGKADRNPVKDIPWRQVPAYSGTAWFMPLIGLYYKTLDRIS